MSRRWGPTGVDTVTPAPLAKDRREQIRLEIRKIERIASVPKAFYEALEFALGNYESSRKIADSSKPAKVRGNLTAAYEAALELSKRLNKLDSNAHLLISTINTDGASALQKYLSRIVRILSQASDLAQEYPKKGRLPEYHRLWLAVDVADAIRRHLAVEPTTTRDGLFDSLLSIVLEIATGHEVQNVSKLTQKALQAQRIESGEMTEYIPS